jgi:hypothetical protein
VAVGTNDDKYWRQTLKIFKLGFGVRLILIQTSLWEITFLVVLSLGALAYVWGQKPCADKGKCLSYFRNKNRPKT